MAVLLLWIVCVIYVLCLSCFRICSLLPCGYLLVKGLTAWLLFVMFNYVFGTFPCGILGQVRYLIVSIPDLCRLSYFYEGFTGVYLLDFFCSGIQFYWLLSPYLCFISLLYLDLYVLGDDALISLGSLMQTKYLCVLIHIWIKGEVGAVIPI